MKNSKVNSNSDRADEPISGDLDFDNFNFKVILDAFVISNDETNELNNFVTNYKIPNSISDSAELHDNTSYSNINNTDKKELLKVFLATAKLIRLRIEDRLKKLFELLNKLKKYFINKLGEKSNKKEDNIKKFFKVYILLHRFYNYALVGNDSKSIDQGIDSIIYINPLNKCHDNEDNLLSDHFEKYGNLNNQKQISLVSYHGLVILKKALNRYTDEHDKKIYNPHFSKAINDAKNDFNNIRKKLVEDYKLSEFNNETFVASDTSIKNYYQEYFNTFYLVYDDKDLISLKYSNFNDSVVETISSYIEETINESIEAEKEKEPINDSIEAEKEEGQIRKTETINEDIELDEEEEEEEIPKNSNNKNALATNEEFLYDIFGPEEFLNKSDIVNFEESENSGNEQSPLDAVMLEKLITEITCSNNNNNKPIEFKITNREHFKFGYETGFLVRNESDDSSQSMTKFDFKKFVAQMAEYTLDIDKSSLKIYLMVLNYLCLIFNTVPLSENNMVSYMEKGEMNLILNEIVTCITESVFHEYLEKLDNEIYNKLNNDPKKKANKKAAIRRRFSRNVLTIISAISLEPDTNQAIFKQREDSDSFIQNLNPINDQEQLLIGNLLTIFNNMEETIRVEILNSNKEQWDDSNLRSNVLQTKFEFQKKLIDASNEIKIIIDNPPSGPLVKSAVDNKYYKVYGIKSHRGEKSSNIEFLVDFGPDFEAEWVPFKPDLCKNIHTFDYLRDNYMRKIIPKNFKSYNIIKILSHEKIKTTKLKANDINYYAFTVTRENSNYETLETYQEILDDGFQISIDKINKYIFKKLKKLSKIEEKEKEEDENNIPAAEEEDDQEEDKPEEEKEIMRVEEAENSDEEEDEENNIRVIKEVLVSFFNSEANQYNEPMKKRLLSIVEKFENTIDSRETVPSNTVAEFNKNKVSKELKAEIIEVESNGLSFNDLLLDFYELISHPDVENLAKNINGKLKSKINSMIKNKKYKLADYDNIVLQNSLCNCNGVLSEDCTKITLSKYLDMFPISKTKQSGLAAIKQLDNYPFFIENLIHMINAILFDSEFNSMIFLPQSFIKV